VRWHWIAAAFSLVLLAWLVTEGDWDFFPPGGFLERFYDGQAQSLLHGRIDVPLEAIAPEAFMRNGKAYGYFGPTPALARLPLELLLPGMHGRWNRLSMLLASALMMGALILLLGRLESRLPLEGGRRLRNLLTATLIFATAIGSTNFFLSSESKVYQEAIIWGSALAFAQAVFLACYLMDPKGKWLALSCTAAFLAFFARTSVGAGPVFSLFLVDMALLIPSARLRAYWISPLPRRTAAVVLSATLIVTAASWAGLNYWKFGMVFTTQPVALNQKFDQQRLQRVKGDLVSLNNLPLTLSNYFSPANISFDKRFPWVALTLVDPAALAARFPKAHLDSVEPFASLPSAMPAILLAAIAGTVLCLTRRRNPFRALRAPLCGALAGCAVVFNWGMLSYRLLHDTFAWLAVGSAIAITWIPSIERKRLRYGLAGLFVAATAYAMWANFAFAIVQQRYLAFPIRPEKRFALWGFARAVDTNGLKGFLDYASHWHAYIPAASFQSGNLVVDRSERSDQPTVRAEGQLPNRAEYVVDAPGDGDYQLAILYASGEPRPVRLSINGVDVTDVCGLPTGGWSIANRGWLLAGGFHLNRGMNRIVLTRNGPFPYISMLRLVRMD
jgi:hypothetical protein